MHRRIPYTAGIISALALTHAAHGATVGPGFGVSGYAVTATASPGLNVVQNANTNPGGSASAFFNNGGVVGSAAIASATEGK
jgi:hypothetical protein